MTESRSRHGMALLWMLAPPVLAGLVLTGLATGAFPLTPFQVMETLAGQSPSRGAVLAVFTFRMPRILLSLLSGLCLGLSGALLQGLTRNPLADPGMVGVNAASTMMVVLFLALPGGSLRSPAWFASLAAPLFGIAGALVCALLLGMLLGSRTRGARPVLTGMALASGFQAITLMVSLRMDPADYETAARWMAGSMAQAGWPQVAALAPWIPLLVPLALRQSRNLDLLQLDDLSARGLGLDPARARMHALLVAVALAGAASGMAGSLAFTGLLAPWMARKLVGVRHHRLLPASALLGMILTCTADLAGKNLASPREIPAGIITALAGGPWFLFLMMRTASRKP